jgi:chemotaxis protein histidine kinase CheA
MQQPADNPSASNFAGVLAALAAPSRKSAPAWDDDLADDVITLSYERALSTHARYRSSARNDCALTELPDPEPPRKAVPPLAAAPLPQQAPTFSAAPQPAAATQSPAQEKRRKDASITIRLSAEECEQLHQRAAEAGLTLSAYLRSCTLEAETLRALVKSTLAQMQTGSLPQAPAAPLATPPSKPRFAWFRFDWFRNLLPQRLRTARA